MGLLNPVTEFLVIEHKRKPLGPKILFIGRQTVPLSKATLDRLLHRHGFVDQNKGPVEFDEETRSAEDQRFITDRYFMRALGVEQFHALDVTDYEGADIVWDLGKDIPEKYHGQYDFIYNGGCFDNMFNPGVAMMNLSKLLKPDGRMICMESASSWNSPYLIYSPGWFFDFYAVNNYASANVYLASYKDNDDLFYGPWDMSYVNVMADPNGPSPEAIHGNHLILLTCAEKSDRSTDTVQPVQAQYRTTTELQKTVNDSVVVNRDMGRPMLNGQAIDDKIAPYLTKVGMLGADLREVPQTGAKKNVISTFFRR